MKRSRLSGAVCACLLLLCLQSAHAVVSDDVIYDNGVLVSDIDAGISSATITGTPEIVRQIADDFILDSGSTWSVTDVHWLGWDIENDPTSTFDIYFYADNGGKPTGGPGDPSATAIATRSVNVTGLDTGETYLGGGSKIFEYSTLVDPVELVGGLTYWLAIQSTDGENWNWALDRREGGNAQFWGSDFTPDNWTDLGDAFNQSCFGGCSAAFQLTGVPVPAALWLFGSGLLGLVGIARRRKAA
jgi:hypothetical protein